MISLKGYKVIYNKQVLNAISVLEWDYPEDVYHDTTGYRKLKFLTILVVDTNGNLKTIHDEAWCFQFVPIVTKECEG